MAARAPCLNRFRGRSALLGRRVPRRVRRRRRLHRGVRRDSRRRRHHRLLRGTIHPDLCVRRPPPHPTPTQPTTARDRKAPFYLVARAPRWPAPLTAVALVAAPVALVAAPPARDGAKAAASAACARLLLPPLVFLLHQVNDLLRCQPAPLPASASSARSVGRREERHRAMAGCWAHLVRDAQVLDRVAAHVALGDAPEPVAVLPSAPSRMGLIQTAPRLRTPPPPVPKRSRTRDVQMTSRRMMFIKLSQLTKWPLYVSPLFSSTSCAQKAHRRAPQRTAANERRERDGRAAFQLESTLAHKGARALARLGKARSHRQSRSPPPSFSLFTARARFLSLRRTNARNRRVYAARNAPSGGRSPW